MTELKKYIKFEDEKEIDPVKKIVLLSYLKIFSETKHIPSVSDISYRIEYDYEACAYDIIYGVPLKEFTSLEKIALILTEEKYIFKWGCVVLGDAQQVLFQEIEEDEGFIKIEG